MQSRGKQRLIAGRKLSPLIHGLQLHGGIWDGATIMQRTMEPEQLKHMKRLLKLKRMNLSIILSWTLCMK